MAKQIQRPKTLCVCGKTINIEKILEKSQAQFAAQLKANGVVLPEDELTALYNQLTYVPSEEELAQAEQGK